ncbi:hypothetical protein Tdes44962_MAKER09244 [Teratosphaeria destructans]|uniref:Uncharacterized protein n=1 Tax=Teratosphaeria destructans TaxID=418781 RepID=A0A9W7W3A6_9PEZI|nr:hypothetical protein Tdes44962_MAKER09244 [Teratosphaeria destructans]
MPPVPVHIDDPITPTKAKGVVPQTLPLGGTATGTTTTTTTPPQSQSVPPYPAARPGQAAVPAPTPYIPSPQPAPLPSRTTSLAQNDPPPPQPGAVPVPTGQYTPQVPSTLPPPPRAGETLKQQQEQRARQAQQTPFASTLPPPELNSAPTYSTSMTTTTPLRGAGPTTLNMGAVGPPGHTPTVSSDHPSGYQQDIYAQEMSPAQRASLDRQDSARRPSLVQSLGLSPGGSAGGQGLGGVNGIGNGQDMSEMAGQAWQSAKKWLGDAGTKLVETEEEVWRRINGK